MEILTDIGLAALFFAGAVCILICVVSAIAFLIEIIAGDPNDF